MAHVSWVRSVLHRSCTTYHNGRLGSVLSRSWSVQRVHILFGGTRRVEVDTYCKQQSSTTGLHPGQSCYSTLYWCTRHRAKMSRTTSVYGSLAPWRVNTTPVKEVTTLKLVYLSLKRPWRVKTRPPNDVLARQRRDTRRLVFLPIRIFYVRAVLLSRAYQSSQELNPVGYLVQYHNTYSTCQRCQDSTFMYAINTYIVCINA